MPGPVFLRGERVTLRPPEDEDVEFLQRTHNDPAVRRSMPRVHPQNRAAIREEYVESDGTVGLLICESDGRGEGERGGDGASDENDPDRLGFCALFDIDADSGRAEVGAWLAPDAEGQGYATEALSLLVEYAFAERRLDRLNAGRLATNDRSAALLDRLGFVEEGRRRGYYFVGGERVDRVEYGLLAEEWDGT
ncbi:GNAT family N-acetyltransferase [Halosimplex halophilum]|uniref:GNAT family N-acetyltransferase n=1 Tax=Halosimplex halophilum TaxID=2559572 RepID=UPI00107FD0D9|nr:GNAT family protein [Halosimplex halophilum]